MSFGKKNFVKKMSFSGKIRIWTKNSFELELRVEKMRFFSENVDLGRNVSLDKKCFWEKCVSLEKKVCCRVFVKEVIK